VGWLELASSDDDLLAKVVRRVRKVHLAAAQLWAACDLRRGTRRPVAGIGLRQAGALPLFTRTPAPSSMMYNVMYTGGDDMTQMVRKQIYLRRQQQVLLRRLARVRGVSEAEIIRQMLDEKFNGGPLPRGPRDPEALQGFIQAALGRRTHGQTASRYDWNREDLYSDRPR